MRLLSNCFKKMLQKYSMPIAGLTMVVVGIGVSSSPVYAQNQHLVNNEMVSQLIVKLKPSDNFDATNLQSHVLTSSPSKIPLEKLQLVIDRVQKTRMERSRLSRIQNNVGVDVASHMRAKKAIDSNMMVISLGGAVSRSDTEQLMKDIAADTAVEYVEPDVRVSHFRSPTDPRYLEQWGYYNEVGGANLPTAWDYTEGSANIVVAVVDTGYLHHADLIDNLQLPGNDFISDENVANGGGLGSDGSDFGDWVTTEEANDSSSPFYGCYASDSSWHGSHVAGTIGAVSNNRLGVSGISWKGKILPVRVLGKCGGLLSDVLIGMRWAAGLSVAIDNVPVNSHPAKVLNLSLGASQRCPSSFADTIKEIKNKGASVVVAAGNSSEPVSNSMPANCAGVIAVAATDKTGNLAYFSNYGTGVAISAPGVGILSTIDAGKHSPELDSYASYSGTSMAAPHVAGAVALMLAVNPQLTPDQVRQVLQASARKFPAGSKCTKTKCGAGLLDVGKAIEMVKKM